MKFPVFLLLILFGWSQGWTARAKESPEKANPVFVRSTLSLYDPPTCQLSNKNGLVRQTVCYGETVKITATTSDENATVQWHRQNTTGGWTAVSGATQSNLTTGPGIYKADLLFPIQLLAQAQPLPPGTYRNLKPTRPLVLQKGEYVFINLTMRHLGKGIWLDGRKAKSLRLQGCRFEGNANGTAVVTNGNAQIIKSTFTNMKTGIQVLDKSGNTKTLTIQSNTFTNNQFGVYLDGGDLNLELKCNVFEQTTTIPSGQNWIGLLIGEGVGFPNNNIGGNNSQNAPGSPNSNYFPRSVNATTGEIEPFPGYYSVWNESANSIKYFNYGNEDIGNYHPFLISDPNYINLVSQSEITISRKNLELWCGEGIPANWQNNGYVTFSDLSDCRGMTQLELETLQTNPGPPDPPMIPALWKLACEGGPLDNIAFPIPRPVPADGETTTLIKALQEEGVYLGLSIPNPAQDKVTIPVFLPVLKGNATLEVFELSTGKSIVSKIIPGFGHHLVELDTRLLASGMYGYRMVLGEGKSPAPRKMVILR